MSCSCGAALDSRASTSGGVLAASRRSWRRRGRRSRTESTSAALSTSLVLWPSTSFVRFVASARAGGRCSHMLIDRSSDSKPERGRGRAGHEAMLPMRR